MATEIPHNSMLVVPINIGTRQDIELLTKNLPNLHEYCIVSKESGDVQFAMVSPTMLCTVVSFFCSKEGRKFGEEFKAQLFTALGHCIGKGLLVLRLSPNTKHASYERITEWSDEHGDDNKPIE